MDGLKKLLERAKNKSNKKGPLTLEKLDELITQFDPHKFHQEYLCEFNQLGENLDETV